VGLPLGLDLLAQVSDLLAHLVQSFYEGVRLRLVGWLVGARSGLVGLEEHENMVALPLGCESTALYPPTHGLDANAENLGSFRHGDAATGSRPVLSHMGDTRPLGLVAKALYGAVKRRQARYKLEVVRREQQQG
jgi:hypothetical protein